MSDPHFGGDDGERSNEGENLTSLTRYPRVTDSLDTVFDLLSNAHRRYLLYYLLTIKGDVVEFEAAVNAVCKYEAAGTDSDDYATFETIRMELHHSHLPKLAEAGVIDYDRRQGTIRATPTPPLEEWVEYAEWKELDCATSTTNPSSRILSVSKVSTGLLESNGALTVEGRASLIRQV